MAKQIAMPRAMLKTGYMGSGHPTIVHGWFFSS